MEAHLSSHHRDTIEKISSHPPSPLTYGLVAG